MMVEPERLAIQECFKEDFLNPFDTPNSQQLYQFHFKRLVHIGRTQCEAL